jgi:hypothetical protein
MKITISKSQWEEMGKKAGWKVAQEITLPEKTTTESPTIEKMKSLNATEQQINSAKKIIERYKKEPKNIYPYFGAKTIMLDFGFITIGIEPDGEAHS